MAESLKVPARVWRATIAGWLAEERWGKPDRLSMPVAILWGDQDAVVPREEQDALAAAVGHAVLSVYRGTGHALQWEEPEQFSRDLEDFMRVSRAVPAK